MECNPLIDTAFPGDSFQVNIGLATTGMTDKKGEPFNAYIKINEEKGKLDFFRWNPDRAQKATPDNAGQTQARG